MSSTKRGSLRDPSDFYVTPAWCVEAVLPHLAFYSVLDPAAGEGAILDAVKHVYPEIRTSGIEIDEQRCATCQPRHQCQHADALETKWPIRDVVMMNPPFKLAMPFVERALKHLKDGRCLRVVALLRLGFLASSGRREFWHANQCSVFVLPRRPSFCTSFECRACEHRWIKPAGTPMEPCPECGSGDVRRSTTDSADYFWAVWGSQLDGICRVL